MKKIIKVFLFIYVVLITGCASVHLASTNVSENAKQFNPPAQDKAGLYIYRPSVLGMALKKDIWVNEECVGQSASKVFFYYEVPGNKEHMIVTESEFSPNELRLSVIGGVNYFIEQYIKLGAFVGGANLRVVDPEIAKKEIINLDMAVNGDCSSSTPYKK